MKYNCPHCEEDVVIRPPPSHKLGAALGIVIGAITGRRTFRGALVGSAVGAGLGYLFDHAMGLRCPTCSGTIPTRDTA